jgi:GTPase
MVCRNSGCILLVLRTNNVTIEGLKVLEARLHLLPAKRLVVDACSPFVVVVFRADGE